MNKIAQTQFQPPNQPTHSSKTNKNPKSGKKSHNKIRIPRKSRIFRIGEMKLDQNRNLPSKRNVSQKKDKIKRKENMNSSNNHANFPNQNCDKQYELNEFQTQGNKKIFSTKASERKPKCPHHVSKNRKPQKYRIRSSNRKTKTKTKTKTTSKLNCTKSHRQTKLQDLFSNKNLEFISTAIDQNLFQEMGQFSNFPIRFPGSNRIPKNPHLMPKEKTALFDSEYKSFNDLFLFNSLKSTQKINCHSFNKKKYILRTDNGGETLSGADSTSRYQPAKSSNNSNRFSFYTRVNPTNGSRRASSCKISSNLGHSLRMNPTNRYVPSQNLTISSISGKSRPKSNAKLSLPSYGQRPNISNFGSKHLKRDSQSAFLRTLNAPNTNNNVIRQKNKMTDCQTQRKIRHSRIENSVRQTRTERNRIRNTSSTGLNQKTRKRLRSARKLKSTFESIDRRQHGFMLNQNPVSRSAGLNLETNFLFRYKQTNYARNTERSRGVETSIPQVKRKQHLESVYYQKNRPRRHTKIIDQQVYQDLQKLAEDHITEANGRVNLNMTSQNTNNPDREAKSQELLSESGLKSKNIPFTFAENSENQIDFSKVIGHSANKENLENRTGESRFVESINLSEQMTPCSFENESSVFLKNNLKNKFRNQKKLNIPSGCITSEENNSIFLHQHQTKKKQKIQKTETTHQTEQILRKSDLEKNVQDKAQILNNLNNFPKAGGTCYLSKVYKNENSKDGVSSSKKDISCDDKFHIPKFIQTEKRNINSRIVMLYQKVLNHSKIMKFKLIWDLQKCAPPIYRKFFKRLFFNFIVHYFSIVYWKNLNRKIMKRKRQKKKKFKIRKYLKRMRRHGKKLKFVNRFQKLERKKKMWIRKLIIRSKFIFTNGTGTFKSCLQEIEKIGQIIPIKTSGPTKLRFTFKKFQESTILYL